MALTKITSNAFAASAVDSDAVGANTITTAKIADTNVTHAKLHTDMDLSSKTVTLPSLSQNLTVTGQIRSNVTGGSLYTSTAGGIPRLFLGGGSGFGINRQSSSEDIFFGEPGDTGTWRVRGAGTISLGVGNSTTTMVVQGNGGNVGIGTASPVALLDVSDSTSNEPQIRLTTATATNYLSIARDSSTGHYEFKSEETGSAISFHTDPDGTGSQNRLHIDRYGNVGIGTDSPNHYNNWTTLTLNNISGAEIDFEVNGTLYADFFANSGDMYMRHHNGNLRFYTGGSATENERARITSAGNVGIGDSTPQSRLEVRNNTDATDTILATANLTTAGNYHNLLLGDGPNYAVGLRRHITVSNPSYLRPRLDFVVQGSDTYLPADREVRMSITHNGKVGIGTTNPSTKFHVQSEGAGNSNGTFYLGVDTPTNYPAMVIQTSTGGNGTETHGLYIKNTAAGYGLRIDDTSSDTSPFVVDTEGRVGIGTTTPGHTLDLRGSANLRNTNGLLFFTDNGTQGATNVNGGFIGMAHNAGYHVTSSDGGFGSNANSLVIANKHSGGGDIIFATTDDGTYPSGRMIVKADQVAKVGIGTDDPDVAKGLHIQGGLFVEQLASDPNNVSGDDQTVWIKRYDNKDWALTADANAGTATDYGIRVRTTTGATYGFALEAGGAYRFRVAGDGDVTNSNNSYGSISDIKLKENVQDAGSQWDDIKALRIRKYSFKSDNLDSPNQIGVIAQELDSAGMSGLVKTVDDIDSDKNPIGTTTKQVKYSVLYMKSVKALQEAIIKIETLESQVTDLTSRIEALEE